MENYAGSTVVITVHSNYVLQCARSRVKIRETQNKQTQTQSVDESSKKNVMIKTVKNLLQPFFGHF